VSKRSRQTLTPLAKKLGIEVNEDFSSGEEDDLAKHAQQRTGAVLICWRHHSLHVLAQHVLGITRRTRRAGARTDLTSSGSWTSIRPPGSTRSVKSRRNCSTAMCRTPRRRRPAEGRRSSRLREATRQPNATFDAADLARSSVAPYDNGNTIV
jgi:hypothetical protein